MFDMNQKYIVNIACDDELKNQLKCLIHVCGDLKEKNDDLKKENIALRDALLFIRCRYSSITSSVLGFANDFRDKAQDLIIQLEEKINE